MEFLTGRVSPFILNQICELKDYSIPSLMVFGNNQIMDFISYQTHWETNCHLL
jgi:hypothetical protein